MINVCIVYPPKAGTGLRHLARDGRTLCGRDAGGWYTEASACDPSTAGCKRCISALRLDGMEERLLSAALGEKDES